MNGDGHMRGVFSIIRLILPPNGSLPCHAHTEYEETFFVLKGVLSFSFRNSLPILTDGDFVRVRAGTWHGCTNLSANSVELLVGLPPGEAEGFLGNVRAPGFGTMPLNNVSILSNAHERNCVAAEIPVFGTHNGQ